MSLPAGPSPAVTSALARWRAFPEERRGVLLVAAAASLVFLPWLGAVGLWDPWEGHYAEVARQMLVRQDFVHPYYELAWFFSKPVLLMWVSAAAMALAGAQSRALPQGSVPDGATPSGLSAYTEWAVRLPVALLAVVACALVFVAVGRLVSRRAGYAASLALATAALPEAAAGRTDLAAAPRRALLAVVELAAAVIVLLPIIAVTQPFLPGVPGAAVLAVVVLLLGVGFWRSAANLQGHVRAGAQVLVEALAKQGAPAGAQPQSSPGPDPLAAFRALFPGLGDPVAVRLRDGSPAAGRSLSALGVRGRTGATILAIFRGERSVMLPLAGELLEPRDLLVLAGTHEAVEAARELLAADPDAAPAGPLPGGTSAA